MKKKIILFSGRFNPPHLGHFSTITDLAEKYGKVKVIILDYPKRKFPITYCVRVLKDELSKTKLDIEIIANKIHFEKIKKEEIEQFKPFDLFVSVNLKVLRHVESLGIPCEYVDFSYQYKASLYSFPE